MFIFPFKKLASKNKTLGCFICLCVLLVDLLCIQMIMIFVSCIFSISLGSGDGDRLHKGGCRVDFNLQVGDLVIADTDIFFHGSPSYQGNEHPKIISENDRLVGLFILYQKFMIMKGVPADDLEREPYEFQNHSKPKPEKEEGS